MWAPFLGIISGIIISSSGVTFLVGSGIVLLSLLIYLVFLRVSSSPQRAIKVSPYNYIWIYLLFTGIGIIDGDFHRPYSLSSSQISKIDSLEGTISDISYLTRGDRLTLKVKNLDLKSGEKIYPGNLEINIFSSEQIYKKGEIVSCKVSEIKKYEPNFKRIGFSITENYYANVSEEDICIIGESLNPIYFAQNLRDRLAIKIENSQLSRETSEFMISLLLGDKTLLKNERKKSFNASGLSHILALSGMHVSIITAFLFFIFFPLRVFNKSRLLFIIVILLIWLYTFLTGMSPSTLRAAIMTSFVLTAIMLERKRNGLRALMTATFIILVFDPLALFNLGLQLSFICVAALIIFVNPLNPIDLSTHPRLYKTLGSIIVTSVAVFSTFPLVSYYFGQIPLLFLPVNFLLLPLLPGFMGMSLIYFVLLGFGIDSGMLANVLDIIYSLFKNLCDYISSQPKSILNFQIDIYGVIIWIVGLILLAFAFKSNKRKILSLMSVSLFLIALFLAPSSKENSILTIEKDRNQIIVSYDIAEGHKEKRFPRKSVSSFSYGPHEIVSLDIPFGNLNKILPDKNSEDSISSYLLISSGIKDLGLKEIENLERFEKIIIHPSIGIRKAQKLFEEAEELGIDLYSLRDDGPLLVSF